MSEPNETVELEIEYVDHDDDDWGKSQETYDDIEEEIDWLDY